VIKKHFTESEQTALHALFVLKEVLGQFNFEFRSRYHFFRGTFDEMITGRIREQKTDAGNTWRKFRDIVFISKGNPPFVMKVVVVSHPQHSNEWEVREIVVGRPILFIDGKSRKKWGLNLTETLPGQRCYADWRKLFEDIKENRRIDEHSPILTEKDFIS